MRAGINRENARGCLIPLRYRARRNCVADVEAAANGSAEHPRIIDRFSLVVRAYDAHALIFLHGQRRLLRFRESLALSACIPRENAVPRDKMTHWHTREMQLMSKIIVARPPSVSQANRERSGRTSSRVGILRLALISYVHSVRRLR